MKKARKTRYCIHYHNCDRDKDCMNGKYCPLFENNPDTYMRPNNVEVEDFEDIMDDIWEGKT